jgi:hypothetical protein
MSFQSLESGTGILPVDLRAVSKHWKSENDDLSESAFGIPERRDRREGN